MILKGLVSLCEHTEQGTMSFAFPFKSLILFIQFWIKVWITAIISLLYVFEWCCQTSGGKIGDESGKTFLDNIQPLLQALDVLTNFASSTEFASIPAKISDQVWSTFAKFYDWIEAV